MSVVIIIVVFIFMVFSPSKTTNSYTYGECNRRVMNKVIRRSCVRNTRRRFK